MEDQSRRTSSPVPVRRSNLLGGMSELGAMGSIKHPTVAVMDAGTSIERSTPDHLTS